MPKAQHNEFLAADFFDEPLHLIPLPDLQDELDSLEWEQLSYERATKSQHPSHPEHQQAAAELKTCRAAIAALKAEISRRQAKQGSHTPAPPSAPSASAARRSGQPRKGARRP